MADIHKLKKYKAYLQAHPSGEKVFQVLRKLSSLPVTVSILQETGLGKVVNSLRKNDTEIGLLAKSLISAWKLLVKEAVNTKAHTEHELVENTCENDVDNNSDDEIVDTSDEKLEEGATVSEAKYQETNDESEADNDNEESEQDKKSEDNNQEIRLLKGAHSGNSIFIVGEANDENNWSGKSYKSSQVLASSVLTESESAGDSELSSGRIKYKYNEKHRQQRIHSTSLKHPSDSYSSSKAENHSMSSKEIQHKRRNNKKVEDRKNVFETLLSSNSGKCQMVDRNCAEDEQIGDRYSNKYRIGMNSSEQDPGGSLSSNDQKVINSDQLPSYCSVKSTMNWDDVKSVDQHFQDPKFVISKVKKYSCPNVSCEKLCSDSCRSLSTLINSDQRTNKHSDSNKKEYNDKCISAGNICNRHSVQGKYSESAHSSIIRYHSSGKHRRHSTSNKHLSSDKHLSKLQFSATDRCVISGKHSGKKHSSLNDKHSEKKDSFQGDKDLSGTKYVSPDHKLVSSDKDSVKQNYQEMKSDTEHNLFEVFSDPTALKDKVDPAEKKFVSCDDYEEYIDQWLEEGVTEYNPGSVKGRFESGMQRQSFDDYEEHIERQVDDSCVKYSPIAKHLKKQYIAFTNKISLKENSQSPDDYSEYIESGVMTDCTEYKPCPKNKSLELNTLCRKHNSNDFSELVDEVVKKDYVEYKPGYKYSDRQDLSHVRQKLSPKVNCSHFKNCKQDVKGNSTECSIKSGKEMEQSAQNFSETLLEKLKNKDKNCVKHQDKEREMQKKKLSKIERENKNSRKSKSSPHKSELEHKSCHRFLQHSSSSTPKQEGMAINLQQDGKCFQELEEQCIDVKSTPSKHPSPQFSEDRERHANKLKRKEIGLESKLTTHFPPTSLKTSDLSKSSGSKSSSPGSSVRKSSKITANAKALIEDVLFSAPDDHSIKVPERLKQKQRESFQRYKNHPKSQSTSTVIDCTSSDKSSNKIYHMSNQRSEKSSFKINSSNDKSLKTDRSADKINSDPISRSDETVESLLHNAEPTISFEDFMNYDETEALKTKKMRKQLTKREIFDLPLPAQPKQLLLSENEILSFLPETSINYRPRRLLPVDESKRMETKDDSLDPVLIVSKNTTRTQVYSGRRQIQTEMKSLFELSTQVLIDNIDAIDYVGGIPYDVLKPVLSRATATQLYNLEDYNPHFLEDTDPLWKIHCQRDFRDCKPDEMETWRELYLRKYDEREAKYQKLRDNMSKTMTKGQTGRKVRMAFMDTVAKPPREVRRQQIKHGTVGVVRGGTSETSSLTHKHHIFVPVKPQKYEPEEQSIRPFVRSMAPMMQKTLKMMTKLRR